MPKNRDGATASKEGRYIGIGLATCQERSVFSATEFWMLNHEAGFALTSSPEGVKVKINPTGNAVITLQAPFWGNSPETMATMLLAEHLTMDPANISVTYADTDSGIAGTGPGGSRFTVMVAGAIVSASQVIGKKLFLLAAHLLDADPSDMELFDGKIRVKGRQGVEKSIADLAMMAHFFRLSFPDTPEFDTGLDASCTYDHPLTTMPSEDRRDLGIFYPIMGHMCHMPVVEVDVEAGKVKFLDYVAVHDCGTIVNPITLAGHVRGGTAQGIGSAIYEEYKYADDGQLLNANFADYILPSVHDVPPNIRVGHVVTPSPFTEYAIASAIEDALKPFRVKADFLPLTPPKLRGLLREATASP
ncbi:xanthine dehydrogenase family protein molybdopterin-binding subunit [Bradyrhizobium sp. USDA 3315]